MLDFIHRYMPDWAIRIFIGVIAWFFICLFFITPFVYDRITLPLRKDFIEQVSLLNEHWGNKDDHAKSMEYVNCLYSVYYAHHEYEFTEWVATGTYYKPYPIRNMGKLINESKYKNSCGTKPWKNEKSQENS